MENFEDEKLLFYGSQTFHFLHVSSTDLKLQLDLLNFVWLIRMTSLDLENSN